MPPGTFAGPPPPPPPPSQPRFFPTARLGTVDPARRALHLDGTPTGQLAYDIGAIGLSFLPELGSVVDLTFPDLPTMERAVQRLRGDKPPYPLDGAVLSPSIADAPSLLPYMLAPANPTLASKYHLCLSKEHEAALGFPPPSSTPVAAPLGGAPVNLGYPPLYAPRPSASGSSIQAGTGGAAFSAAQRELDAVKQQKEALERQLAALDAEKAEKAAEEQRVQETAAKEALELEKARSDAGRAEKQEAGLRSHLEKVLRELAEVDAVPSSRRDYWVSKFVTDAVNAEKKDMAKFLSAQLAPPPPTWTDKLVSHAKTYFDRVLNIEIAPAALPRLPSPPAASPARSAVNNHSPRSTSPIAQPAHSARGSGPKAVPTGPRAHTLAGAPQGYPPPASRTPDSGRRDGLAVGTPASPDASRALSYDIRGHESTQSKKRGAEEGDGGAADGTVVEEKKPRLERPLYSGEIKAVPSKPRNSKVFRIGNVMLAKTDDIADPDTVRHLVGKICGSSWAPPNLLDQLDRVEICNAWRGASNRIDVDLFFRDNQSLGFALVRQTNNVHALVVDSNANLDRQGIVRGVFDLPVPTISDRPTQAQDPASTSSEAVASGSPGGARTVPTARPPFEGGIGARRESEGIATGGSDRNRAGRCDVAGNERPRRGPPRDEGEHADGRNDAQGRYTPSREWRSERSAGEDTGRGHAGGTDNVRAAYAARDRGGSSADRDGLDYGASEARSSDRNRDRDRDRDCSPFRASCHPPPCSGSVPRGSPGPDPPLRPREGLADGQNDRWAPWGGGRGYGHGDGREEDDEERSRRREAARAKEEEDKERMRQSDRERERARRAAGERTGRGRAEREGSSADRRGDSGRTGSRDRDEEPSRGGSRRNRDGGSRR